LVLKIEDDLHHHYRTIALEGAVGIRIRDDRLYDAVSGHTCRVRTRTRNDASDATTTTVDRYDDMSCDQARPDASHDRREGRCAGRVDNLQQPQTIGDVYVRGCPRCHQR
jgi:hypothetical protein